MLLILSDGHTFAKRNTLSRTMPLQETPWINSRLHVRPRQIRCQPISGQLYWTSRPERWNALWRPSIEARSPSLFSEAVRHGIQVRHSMTPSPELSSGHGVSFVFCGRPRLLLSSPPFTSHYHFQHHTRKLPRTSTGDPSPRCC